MLRKRFSALAAVAFLSAAAPAPAQETPVHGDTTVPFTPMDALDLDRYAGRWYEIARFPNRHQRGCAAIIAEYAPRRDGNYDVRGTCPDLRPGRRATTMDGVARLDGPAELSIGLTSWLPLFRRTVFVLGISDDYTVAVIGEPRRKYGWIMARTPRLSEARFAAAAEVLARNGYFADLLERPPEGE